MSTNDNQQKGKNGRESQSSGRSLTTQVPLAPLSRRQWPIGRLRSEFDRLFDDFFRGLPGLAAWPEETESRWGVDVRDLDDKLIVRAEAPGFEPGDFDIQVRDNQLQLCACQSEEKTTEGEQQWSRQELFRSVALPSGIDAEHVDAQYRNGVLTVTLPKTEESKAKRIEVKP